jgi:hypothetical protein
MSRNQGSNIAKVNWVKATGFNFIVLAGIVLAGIVLAGSAVLLATGPASAQENGPPYNERPANATAVMSTSNGKYDGTYSLSAVARVCGEVPAEMNFAGVPAFGVTLYPDSGEGELTDVTFDSKELVGDVMTSAVFFLSVHPQSPAIGSPSAYVLDTSKPDMRGTAVLTYPEAGTLQLKVNGVNDMGETIELLLTCLPRVQEQ